MGAKRDKEFYNLALWHAVLEKYHQEIGTNIHSPVPYIAQNSNLVMQYAHGTDLDSLFRSETLGHAELLQVATAVGKLLKIKENEGMVHSDLDLRHFLINGGLFVIDLENAKLGNGQSATENSAFTSKIQSVSKKEISDVLNDGFHSIPALHFVDDSLARIKQTYGGRAEAFLKARY